MASGRKACWPPSSSRRVPDRLEQTAEYCWAVAGAAASGRAIRAEASERMAGVPEADERAEVAARRFLYHRLVNPVRLAPVGQIDRAVRNFQAVEGSKPGLV